MIGLSPPPLTLLPLLRRVAVAGDVSLFFGVVFVGFCWVVVARAVAGPDASLCCRLVWGL